LAMATPLTVQKLKKEGAPRRLGRAQRGGNEASGVARRVQGLRCGEAPHDNALSR